jgi:hypothetical protein
MANLHTRKPDERTSEWLEHNTAQFSLETPKMMYYRKTCMLTDRHHYLYFAAKDRTPLRPILHLLLLRAREGSRGTALGRHIKVALLPP